MSDGLVLYIMVALHSALAHDIHDCYSRLCILRFSMGPLLP